MLSMAWVQAVALVAACLLGVPAEHAADIKRWSDARELLTSGVGSGAQLRRAATVFSEMNGFLLGQFEAKRASPGDDLMSVLLDEELDGAPLSEPRLLTYCHQVLSVGNDTTRSLLASFAIALAQHHNGSTRSAQSRLCGWEIARHARLRALGGA